MDIQATKSGKAMVVALTGEIVTRDEHRVVQDTVLKKLAEGERLFVLDLSKVPYVSSLGLAALVAVFVRVDREGGKTRLVNPGPRVANVLEVTKIADIFRTYSNVEEALAAD